MGPKDKGKVKYTPKQHEQSSQTNNTSKQHELSTREVSRTNSTNKQHEQAPARAISTNKHHKHHRNHKTDAESQFKRPCTKDHKQHFRGAVRKRTRKSSRSTRSNTLAKHERTADKWVDTFSKLLSHLGVSNKE